MKTNPISRIRKEKDTRKEKEKGKEKGKVRILWCETKCISEC